MSLMIDLIWIMIHPWELVEPRNRFHIFCLAMGYELETSEILLDFFYPQQKEMVVFHPPTHHQPSIMIRYPKLYPHMILLGFFSDETRRKLSIGIRTM